jgi:ribosomal protein S12 methylthiotransferase accessory factor YcaO
MYGWIFPGLAAAVYHQHSPIYCLLESIEKDSSHC